MKKEKYSLNTKFEKLSRQALWQWIWVVTFSIAFAWVEGSVVIYLREIYFKGSFNFPIVLEWKNGELIVDVLMRVEFVREIATILMLVAVGCAAGKNTLQKFCFFMIAFGVWDIFYYIWLWTMVSWPDSIMTWDLLFFIPVPWVGPVLTPLLIALAMVAAGSLIIYYDEKSYAIYWRWYDWCIELILGLLIIMAFCWDWKNIMRIPDSVFHNGIPNSFAWWLFLPAYLLSVAYFAARLKQIVSANRGQYPDNGQT